MINTLHMYNLISYSNLQSLLNLQIVQIRLEYNYRLGFCTKLIKCLHLHSSSNSIDILA